MLGVLCARPKAWLLSTLSHGGAASFHHRLIKSPIFKPLILNPTDRRRHHTASPSSIWSATSLQRKGEGSWNARPARWLRNPDSAWLLFGVCGCFASPPPPPILVSFDSVDLKLDDDDEEETDDVELYDDHSGLESSYKVKGVPADGRCLFRAIAHMACLRNGEEAPDENRQRELADELRAQVVDELLRRREEAEWFIEGDFDAYVKRIQQPYVWGGEPELLMASHVLKAPISVFMSDRSSGELTKIANYGEDYKKDDESPINVLFHGYGHYDILEIVDQSRQKLKVEHKMR